MSTQEVKVKSAVVNIAGIEINGYQLPDGSYRVALMQVLTAFDIKSRDGLRYFKGSAVPQNLPLTSLKVSYGKGSAVPQRAYLLTIEQMQAAIVFLVQKGSKEAAAVLIASATETWERRFDRAFDSVKTEADYDTLFADLYKRLRQEVRVNFRPCFTDWLNKDADAFGLKINYGAEVVKLKKAIGLSCYTSVNDMTYDELRQWDVAETRYDCYRKAGMNHKQTLLQLNK